MVYFKKQQKQQKENYKKMIHREVTKWLKTDEGIELNFNNNSLSLTKVCRHSKNGDYYDTSCRRSYIENQKFLYCPYCGKRIQIDDD